MDNNSNQHMKNETKPQLKTSNSLNQLERVSKPEKIAEFEETMFLIVSDSYALSSQIVTTAEKMAKAKDWARLLFNIIPENRLEECFAAARENHHSPFAISAYELEDAYRKMPPKLSQRDSDFWQSYAEAVRLDRGHIAKVQAKQREDAKNGIAPEPVQVPVFDWEKGTYELIWTT